MIIINTNFQEMIMPRSVRPSLCPASLLLASASAGLLALALTGSPVQAHNNKSAITVKNGQRCILSNGLPDHATGRFPNQGNPNSIRAQSVRLCVPLKPRKGRHARKIRGSIGVALNGVQIRPGTADYYDPRSPRGFSRDRSSGWNLEGLGARNKLGMDQQNAHVDHRGLYHYHGVSSGLRKKARGTLIGYAADGFEIHYVGNRQASSYRLKKGTRPSGPGGRYDGTYVEDWRYVAGAGTLDQCNGGRLNGKFVYFATKTYPFFPRCLWGSVSRDFRQQRGGHGFMSHQRPGRGQSLGRQGSGGRPGFVNGPRTGRQGQMNGQMTGRFGPPPAALAACRNKAFGAACRFKAPRAGRVVSGQCRNVPNAKRACVPHGHRPPRQ